MIQEQQQAKKAVKISVTEKLNDVILKPVKRLTAIVTKKTFAETVSKPDKSYTITQVYDLKGETVLLPQNTTLFFREGAGLKNGTIIGQNSIILACHKVFNRVSVQGTWKCVGNVAWFAEGCSIPESEIGIYYPMQPVDDTEGLQYALDSAFRELHFQPVPYYITDTLILHKEKRLILHGSRMKSTLDECTEAVRNTTIIWSNRDITLLSISPDEQNYQGKTYQVCIGIEGGCFDVSRCYYYSSPCIEVIANDQQKIWGLFINTTIKGNNQHVGGIGISINPYQNLGVGNNEAFITQVRIDSMIANFEIGIRAKNYQEGKRFFNWCTDAVFDGYITNCPCAIDTDVDSDIRCTIQAGYFFSKKENQQTLVRFTGERATMSSNIYDIQDERNNLWSNQNALEVMRTDAAVTIHGQFHTYYYLSQRLGWPMVKGTVEVAS